jgi:hypothetical protein
MAAWQESFCNPHGTDDLAESKIAAALGLKYVEGYLNNGEKVGISGNTFALKDKIKAAGFRWHGDCKVWYVLRSDAAAAFAKLAA